MTAQQIILIIMLIISLAAIGLLTYYTIELFKLINTTYGIDEKIKNKFNLLYVDNIETEGDFNVESDK